MAFSGRLSLSRDIKRQDARSTPEIDPLATLRYYNITIMDDTPLTFDTIQGTDEGFLLIGDSWRRQPRYELPLFTQNKRPCCTVSPPRKPGLMANTIDDDLWNPFAAEITKVLTNSYRRFNFGVLLFGLLVQLPLLYRVLADPPNYKDFDYEAEQRKQRYPITYMVAVIVCMAVSLFTCLRLNGEHVHTELTDIRNRYAADFASQGFALLYIRDGRAAYIVIRGMGDEKEDTREIV